MRANISMQTPPRQPRAPRQDVASQWSVESSKKLYNTPGWGYPYFSINDEGNLVVRPTGEC
jgi:arginine decarboxylase-like protein